MSRAAARYPRISLVTPSYNQGSYIGWTVRSVLLQRYPNLEYVVMDGGSTDATMQVLEPYAPRLTYLAHEKDNGQADALARGFARCTGDILGYINSDDMLAPGALHFVARFFQDNPGVDAVYSHRVTVNETNRARWYWILPRHINYLMIRWDLIPQETCFWRRRIVDRVGGIDPSYRFAMDYDLFIRIMLAGRMVRVNRFLGVFREHNLAKTTQLLETVGVEEVKRVWRKYGLTNGALDPLISARFFHGVWRNGDRFARDRRVLPGCLPGVGYDYDQLWGGLLSDPALPACGAIKPA